MKCDRCKTETATIHLTQITGDEVVSVNLCPACAQQAGFEETAHHQANVLSALKLFARKAGANPHVAVDQPLEPALKGRRCQMCGTTGENLARDGLLGCPACYQTFADKLKQDFQRFHRHMRHHGRGLTAVDSNLFARSLERAKLRETLNHAVQMEHYEEAAKIRDRLFSLEHGVEKGDER
ncbi:MAG: UvrB/UvrC motif-containing protein [Lentisphaeria bacterium]|nr:UvrB/UvrC motif-containing protein [Lentisphaeria bacterium]